MRLTESDLQIMEVFWSEGKPLSSADILEFSPEDKTWKNTSIYIMIQTLLKKGAIQEIGAVKGEKGKYLRLFEPIISRRDYYSKQLSGTLEAKAFPELFSAFLKDADVNMEIINELEEILKRKKAEMG